MRLGPLPGRPELTCSTLLSASSPVMTSTFSSRHLRAVALVYAAADSARDSEMLPTTQDQLLLGEGCRAQQPDDVSARGTHHPRVLRPPWGPLHRGRWETAEGRWRHCPRTGRRVLAAPQPP